MKKKLEQFKSERKQLQSNVLINKREIDRLEHRIKMMEESICEDINIFKTCQFSIHVPSDDKNAVVIEDRFGCKRIIHINSFDKLISSLYGIKDY